MVKEEKEIKEESKKEEKPLKKKAKKGKKGAKKVEEKKEPLLKLIAYSDEDKSLINGGLREAGVFEEFVEQIQNGYVDLEFTQSEFDEMINAHKFKRM